MQLPTQATIDSRDTQIPETNTVTRDHIHVSVPRIRTHALSFLVTVHLYTSSCLQITGHMPAEKRSYQEMADIPNPFLPIFDGFRVEIDENHLARERIIKASRDVTALSKKA